MGSGGRGRSGGRGIVGWQQVGGAAWAQPGGDSEEDLCGKGNEGESCAQGLLHVQPIEPLNGAVGDEEDEEEVEDRGGAIIGLTAAMENLAKRVLLGEKDPHVACVWRVLLSQQGGAEALARRILDYRLTRERVLEDLSKQPRDEMEHAFQTILRNRVQRGGILAAGASVMKTGENGRGIASRWYPETLARRIRGIGLCRHRMEFVEGDAFDLIRGHLRAKGTALFLDPPYTAGGKRAGRRLYTCNDVDHEDLFKLASSAAGAVMLTYDDAPEVRYLAQRHGFHVQTTPMKNTHHATMVELVITKQPQA